MSRSANATDAHVGKRLQMRRHLLRMSQEVLAAEIGVTFQQVQKYEKGVNRISASRLQDLSHILQVPIQFFFEGLPEFKGAGKGRRDASHSFTSDFLASTEGLVIAKAFTQIKNRKLRRLIAQMMKELAASMAAKK